MNKELLTPRFWLLSIMVLAAAFVRLLPHPPNFAPITAMALFGGAYFANKKSAFIVTAVALFVSDLFLGFHYLVPAVYVSFMLVVLIGTAIKENRKLLSIAGASIASSVLFFVLTNFAEWAFGVMYPKTAVGLAACFTAAIPFFGNTLVGDLFFISLFVALFEAAKYKFPVLKEVKN